MNKILRKIRKIEKYFISTKLGQAQGSDAYMKSFFIKHLLLFIKGQD